MFDLLPCTHRLYICCIVAHKQCAVCCPSVDGLLGAGVLCYGMEENVKGKCTLQLFVAWIFDKSKTLHTRYMRCSRSVRNPAAYARLCAVVLTMLLYFRSLFNLSECSCNCNCNLFHIP